LAAGGMARLGEEGAIRIVMGLFSTGAGGIELDGLLGMSGMR